jgi:hypothetical protein
MTGTPQRPAGPAPRHRDRLSTADAEAHRNRVEDPAGEPRWREIGHDGIIIVGRPRAQGWLRWRRELRTREQEAGPPV